MYREPSSNCDSVSCAEYFFNPSDKDILGKLRRGEFNTLFGNLRLQSAPEKKLRALDVGCSSGRYLQELLGRGFESHGLDIAVIPLLYAKSKVQNANLYRGSVFALPFKRDCFDLVICVGLLQQCTDDNLRVALNQMSDILKPGGILIFDVKNSWNPYLRYLYNKIDGKEIDGIVRTMKTRSLLEMARFAGGVGLKVIKKKGLFSPITWFEPIVIFFCMKPS